MTTIEVTKGQIIKAIKEEPMLRRGTWVSPVSQLSPVSDPTCSVCAVGAVLRAHLGQRQKAWRILDAAGAATAGAVSCMGDYTYARQELEQGRYMAALSCVFEEAEREAQYNNDIEAGEAGRAAAITFVREHFPRRVRININGTRPRRGVKVVK